MSDISNQLIKDSYNYVLQSDLATGIVYRIGGTIPVNPIFQSGLTVNSGFTYSNGTEQLGYVMTCDAFGNAIWAPVSAATPSSGVTSVTAGSGLSGNVTTGAVTLINTSPDQTVTISGGTGIITGGTYPNFTIVNSAPDRTVTITGGTNIEITGTYPDFGVNFTGSTTGGTVSGDYLPLSGGTVTGGTVFQSGLTANTISATTYYNLPVSAVTNGTGISASTTNGTVTITNTLPDQTVTISGGTGIITGGTYPNFTILNSAPDKTVAISGGTNIGVSGTYPDFSISFTGSIPTQGITAITATNGVSANTSNNVATIINTAPDQIVTISGGTGITTGGTYPNFTITNNSPDQTVTLTGGTNIQISGTYPNFGVSYTGQTSFPYLPLSGGTVTGDTNFNSGLTATTISATTYLNLPPQSGASQYFVSATTPTETVYSGDRWFNTNTGVELVWINDGDSSQWIQPFSVPGPLSPDAGYFTYTGLTTGQTLTWDKTYWGISGSSNVNLTLPTTTAKDGYYIIIKDEAGTCGTYRIRLTPASGLIDGNNYVDMNINYMSLTCMVRGGNWYLI